MDTRDLSSLDPEIRALLEPCIREPYDGKFRSKLTPKERCAILAASANGISRPVLAAAFGIDRRTVTHITNKASLHYREVRNEYHRMGHQAFIALYLTKEVAEKINRAFQDPNVNKTGEALRADQAAKRSAEVRKEGPNEQSRKWEGRNTLKLQQHNNEAYVVHILWGAPSEDAPTGWWVYQDDDLNAAVLGPFNTSEEAKRVTEQEHYWM